MSLLDHLKTERGGLSYSDLWSDCQRLPHLPKTQEQLALELAALVRQGLAIYEVSYDGARVEYIPQRGPVRAEQTQLF